MTVALINQFTAKFPLEKLRESAFNPRKTFGSLDELAKSIREKGILQPLTVRPMSDHHEVILGSRRYRAAKLAGITTVPVVIREMSDEQALEAMIVENLQRSDVHPLEEADGFKALQEGDAVRSIKARSVAEIAAKVGKSEGFVHARLKLCGLSTAARKAFLGDKINATIALLVARIPVVKLQDEALAEIVRRGGRIEEARQLIQQRYMLRLDQAQFPIADANLEKTAGPCTTCPKRTGNQRELFSDVKSPDVCTDPVCFKRKSDLAWQRRTKEAAAGGTRILSPAEAKKAFPWDSSTSLDSKSGYIDLAEKHYDDPKERSWKKLIGKEVAHQVVLARDQTGVVHEIVKADVAKRLLKDLPVGKEVAKAAAKSSSQDASWKTQDDRRRRDEKLRQDVFAEVIPRLIKNVEDDDPPTEGFWSVVMTAILDGSWSDTMRDVARRRGWVEKGKQPMEVMMARADSIPVNEQRGLVFELLVSRKATFGANGFSQAFQDACLVYGVDIDGVTKEMKDAEKVSKSSNGDVSRKPKKKGRPKQTVVDHQDEEVEADAGQ